MNNINNRINQLAEYYDLNSYSSFAKKTGLSHQTASNYMKGKQKPDAEKLALIKQSFEDINAEWLLTGNGEMLKQHNHEPDTDTQTQINNLIEANARLSKSVESLSNTLETLSKKL